MTAKDKLVKLNQTIEYLHSTAVTKHKENKLEEALSIYLQTIELYDNQPEWIYGNAIILLSKLNNYEQATKISNKALDVYPKSDEIFRALGISNNNFGNFDKCIECFKKAIALDEQQPDWLYCNLAQLLVDRQKNDEAIEIIQPGIKLYPKFHYLHFYLGEAFMSEGNLEQALIAYKNARRLKPDIADLQIKLNKLISLKNLESEYYTKTDDAVESIVLKETIEEDNHEDENLIAQYSLDFQEDSHNISNTFIGEILCISGNQVIGWIADENQINRNNLTVKLLIDGYEVNKTKANLSKRQFKNLKINDTIINRRCFFCLQIPDIYLTYESLCLEIATPDESILAIRNNYSLSLKGHIDLLNKDQIAGWVVDLNQESPLELDLYVDGIKIKSLFANIERNDVKSGLDCGFHTHFPSRIYASQKIELTLKNSKIPIIGTPKHLITSVGSINVLHKLGQAVKNNLAGLSEDEKRWVNSQLLPSLINQFRSSSKSNSKVNVSYLPNQVFSGSQQLWEIASTVDVIIPVYKNYQVTKQCIESVIKFKKENKTPIDIVVIDDCSPEPEISTYLKDIAAQDSIQLLINEDNKGFVRSVNLGMKLHLDRDVILLNSDAIVNGNWVDRLRHTAYLQENTASVTPISNHASIFSYPFFAEEIGELPHDTSLESLDEICQAVNRDIEIEVPSVHGFCCYLKQSALNETGLFDEQKWEKGYGEEVDWSQRALLLGWKHIAAPGIFVHHVGSQSFTETKHHAIARAQKILSSDYPEYDAVVQDFITTDFLAPYRRRIDVARLKKIAVQYILFICHDFGGGTKKYMADLSDRLAKRRISGYMFNARSTQLD